MRILTDISKAELEYLTAQPTAKEMIQKVKSEGVYIAEGDAQGAANFVAMRKQQKQDALLQISDEGLAALKKHNEENGKKANVDTNNEDQIKEKISKLQKELAEIKSKQATSEEMKKMLDNKANAITQQISALSMQLIQIRKINSEAQ